jgi:2-oxo-4-hydroxy-4-carboxy--5-ureidoimidazoline (OHCU) decarboxylase
MAAPTLPSITSLYTLPLPNQLKAIDTLFEPSPELHNLLQPILSNAQEFSSYDNLIDAIHNHLSALSATNDPQQKQTLYGILGSHPRLGAASPTAQAGLSELSRREQANINKSTDAQTAADQAARLSALNKEYEEKYPGLRYVYDPFLFFYDFLVLKS